jgi:hypothetical protein
MDELALHGVGIAWIALAVVIFAGRGRVGWVLAIASASAIVAARAALVAPAILACTVAALPILVVSSIGAIAPKSPPDPRARRARLSATALAIVLAGAIAFGLFTTIDPLRRSNAGASRDDADERATTTLTARSTSELGQALLGRHALALQLAALGLLAVASGATAALTAGERGSDATRSSGPTRAERRHE